MFIYFQKILSWFFSPMGILFGFFALLYIYNKIKLQFRHIKKDPKCEDCPVPNAKLTMTSE